MTSLIFFFYEKTQMLVNVCVKFHRNRPNCGSVQNAVTDRQTDTLTHRKTHRQASFQVFICTQ